MAAVPESGLLLIADLTGYTAYLSGAEIEHAPTIAGDLLETVVGRLEPPFRLAKFEGDAAFLYVEDGRADPSLLLDAIDSCYLAFRRRLRSIQQASACDCASCRTAPQLDLKFFVHHGRYVRTPIAGRDELAGSSVILVHRLAKGTTAARAHDADGRANGFVVFTGEAVAVLGQSLADVALQSASETVDHLGVVDTHVRDLEGLWQREEASARLVVDGERLLFETEVAVAADAATTWGHLTSPARRARWEGGSVIELGPAGRRPGEGTTLQCVTGRLATIEEVVDWQPFEHVGYRITVPTVGVVDMTCDLRPSNGSTILRQRWGCDPGIDRARARTALEGRRTALGRLAAQIASEAEGVPGPAGGRAHAIEDTREVQP